MNSTNKHTKQTLSLQVALIMAGDFSTLLKIINMDRTVSNIAPIGANTLRRYLSGLTGYGVPSQVLCVAECLANELPPVDFNSKHPNTNQLILTIQRMGLANFYIGYNTERHRLGKRGITMRALKRYMGGGKGYHYGPPSKIMEYVNRTNYRLIKESLRA